MLFTPLIYKLTSFSATLLPDITTHPDKSIPMSQPGNRNCCSLPKHVSSTNSIVGFPEIQSGSLATLHHVSTITKVQHTFQFADYHSAPSTKPVFGSQLLWTSCGITTRTRRVWGRYRICLWKLYMPNYGVVSTYVRLTID